MKAKRFPVWLICFGILAFGAPAMGRIGETIADCQKRYGRPLSAKSFGSDLVCRYVKGGFDVRIVFAFGKAAEVYYRKLSGDPLTGKDFALFLSVNAADSHWVRVDQLAEWKKANKGRENDEARQRELMRDLTTFYVWTRHDGKAEASYDREEGVLLVCLAERLVKSKTETPVDPVNPLGF